MAELTYEEISKLLKYEPETGKLFWLPRDIENCASEKEAERWNGRYAGKEALASLNSDGYLHGAVRDRHYRAHRVAWLLHTGSWPIDQLDHVNGDRSDNRITNLREVSNTENGKNRALQKNNKSGTCGVFWHGSTGKWRSSIKVNGKPLPLGCFDDIDDAIAARKEAERKHDFHKNHGRRTQRLEVAWTAKEQQP